MSPEEVEAAVARGSKDPTLKAVIDFVTGMTSVSVFEACGSWTARTANEQRDVHIAAFVVAMEKAAPTEG